MKAKVTTAFPGRPDNEALPRTIAVGEEITGDLARVAIEQKWAEELIGDDVVAKPVDDMTVDELKAFAAQKGFDLAGATKKADLKAAIQAALKASA